MNFFLITLIIFVLIYLFLNWFAKTSSKKISKTIKTFIIIASILLAFIMAYAGRFIFSLPFFLAIIPLLKTKAGLSIFQLIRIWGLLRMLKNSGRFNFNLDPKKKYTKQQILKSYKNIMKKIHPDISPELTRLAAIVNEAKELVIKETTQI